MDNKSTIKLVFSDATKLGGRGVLYALMTLITYALLNTALFALAYYFYKSTQQAEYNYWFLLGIVVCGILFLVFSFVALYKYVIIKAIQAVYVHLKPFFKKLCSKFIENQAVASGINKSINVESALSDMYGRTVPSIVRKGISLILTQIPVASILLDVKELVKNGSKEDMEDAMFNEVDNYITENILKENSLKMLFGCIAANVVIQSIIIFFFLR